jgi:hypothetical protein
MTYFRPLIACILVSASLAACNRGGGDSSPPENSRPFLMGTTPYAMTPTVMPDWRFDNLDDKDLISLHVDDFWGVPWSEFEKPVPSLPPAWVGKWTTLATQAKSTGKRIYLALSPLTDRKTLAREVLADGNPGTTWAPVDARGCYPFATDAAAATHKAAYINYVKYVVSIVSPDYLSPAVEMNMPFTSCAAADKTAWIQWYTDVHNALKAAYPALPVFATFQQEYMYGIANAESACATGTSLGNCFDARLDEALTVPGDRIAFSSYPTFWNFLPDYGNSFPRDTYARVRARSSRTIWISETGWAAVKLYASYPHGSGSCGAEMVPGTIANDANQETYIRWLLGEADKYRFEGIVWWLNRDYLDGAVAAQCPCAPTGSETCQLADAYYGFGGINGEFVLRVFGNMALRNYDGTPRASHTAWREYVTRRLAR